MALTTGDQADSAAAPAAAPTSRGSPDGRARLDPAHGGPLTDATLAELIGRLINDLSDLADRHIELAKQEINEAKDQALGAVKTLAIGAGIAAAVGLLLVIWLWTAFIWFFNWLGALIWYPWGGSLGWIIGLIVPAIAGVIAYVRFIKRGLGQLTGIRPLGRTRAALKENLEWVQQQRTRSAR